MSLVDWLQLFRAHTAPATVFALLVPYLLAGGRDFAVISSLFVLGHLLHFASLGHNSVMDYRHDLSDPSKAHHPLVAGRIRLKEAHVVVHALNACTAALLASLIYFTGSPASLAFLIIYAALGHAYNDGLDHVVEHSWIPISLCFASLSAVGYTMVRGVDLACLLIMLWSFLTTLYQIGWEGNLKDLWNPAEVSFLRKYAEVSGDYLVRTEERASLLFLSIRAVANSAVIVALMAVLNVDVAVALPVFVAASAVELKALYDMHFARPISRKELLARMGTAEAFEFFRFTCLVGLPCLLLIAYGLTYFVAMNKLLWGTKLGPRV